MAKVSWFEILADDNLRAKYFYESIFGWKIDKTGDDYDYWMIQQESDADIGGGIMNRKMVETRSKINGFVDSIPVDSVDKYAQTIKMHGGKPVAKKHAISGYGWHQYFIDTEGNIFGIMDQDSTAK